MSLPKKSFVMDNYIRVYDDVLDKVSCKTLIEKFEDSHEYFKTVHKEDEDEVISFEQIVLENHDEWESVQEDLLELFKEYIQHYKKECKIFNKQWPTKYGFEAVRMKRYLENDYDRFDSHVDVLDYHSARRFLAFFVYVNDVDEGGETEFLNLYKPGTYIPFKIKPQRGRLLMFPPTWQYYHAGLKPISGMKYLLHSYLHYV